MNASRAPQPCAQNVAGEYEGGRVVYARKEGLYTAPREAGSATLHDADVAHGVSALMRGVRYSLFLLSRRVDAA